MSTNKNNQQDNGAPVDFATPIFEIFQEVLKIIIELLKVLLIFIFKKIFKMKAPLKKIDQKQLSVKKVTMNPDSLGIDTATKKDVLISEIDFKKHSFIVGATGYGKTNLITLLQENSLKKNSPVIFFDPKGDLDSLTNFFNLCRKYNRPCYIFSEYYIDSICLNPVLEGSISTILDRIISSFTWGDNDTYYKEYATDSLFKVLTQLQHKNIPISFKAIYESLKVIEDKDNKGLVNKIGKIIGSDFGKRLEQNSDTKTFSQIRDERACLYIGLSTQGYGETAKALGKIFIQELMFNSYSALTQNINKSALQNPISIYFDEFGSLVTDNFIELQNKCRGAGMELTMAVQTASDIDKVNPYLTKQVIDNVGNLFILKQRLDESASLYSNAIGTIMTTKETHMIEDGESTGKGSKREVNELIVHPDTIKNLHVGQCILLQQDPIKVTHINIRDQKVEAIKRLNEIVRQNNKQSLAF